MENDYVVGEQSSATFSINFTFFNDGGLKLGQFSIFDAFFPFLAFFKL